MCKKTLSHGVELYNFTKLTFISLPPFFFFKGCSVCSWAEAAGRQSKSDRLCRHRSIRPRPALQWYLSADPGEEESFFGEMWKRTRAVMGWESPTPLIPPTPYLPSLFPFFPQQIAECSSVNWVKGGWGEERMRSSTPPPWSGVWGGGGVELPDGQLACVACLFAMMHQGFSAILIRHTRLEEPS